MRSTKKKENGFTTRKFSTEEKKQDYQSYQSKFIKDNYRSFMFRPRRDIDSDVIAHCEAKDNFSGYILRLIKEDMLRQGIIPINKNGLGEVIDDMPLVFGSNAEKMLETKVEMKMDGEAGTYAVLQASKHVDFADLAKIKEAYVMEGSLVLNIEYSSNRSISSICNLIALKITEKAKEENEDLAEKFSGKNNIFTGYDFI